MYVYYYMENNISLRQFDRIMFEGVIDLFLLKYYIKKIKIQFFLHFNCEFLKTVYASLLPYELWILF